MERERGEERERERGREKEKETENNIMYERGKNYSGIYIFFSHLLKYEGIRRVTSRGKLLRPGRSDFLRLGRDYRAATARSEN